MIRYVITVAATITAALLFALAVVAIQDRPVRGAYQTIMP